ncbi:hypothetical protein H8958_010608 [Nasalis larvatus]
MPSLIKKVTSTAKAPKVLGLYGQRVLVDRIIYISGQLVMDSSSAQLVAGEVAKEVKQAFTKMGEVLKTVGCDFTNAADIHDFSTVSVSYKQYFKTNSPAKAAYQVATLAKGV